MELKLQTTESIKRPFWHAVLYGPPKTGKTYFARTMPDPLVICLDEDGMSTLHSHSINYVTPTSWIELLSVISTIEAGLDQKGNFKAFGKEFKSVMLDPLNQVQAFCYSSLQTEGKALSLPNRGLGNDKVEALFRRMCRWPVHVVFTCLERLDKCEHTGRVKATLDVSPALGRKFPAIPSFIWHTVIEPVAKYKISTQQESYYEAGGRYDRNAPPLRVEPDFQKLYTYVTKTKGVQK